MMTSTKQVPKVRKITVQNSIDSDKKEILFDMDGRFSGIPSPSDSMQDVSLKPQTPMPPGPQPSKDMMRNGGLQQQLPLSKQIENFSEIVSIVGIRYAFIPTASRIKKAVWLALVLFGMGFMIYQINDRVLYYLEWPTTVDLRVKYNSTLRFPTVTICNENKMRKQAALDLGITDVLQAILPPFPEVDAFVPNYTAFNPADFNADWYITYGVLGQPIEQAVFKCIYEMAYCNMSEAFEITPTNMGFCYSFNPMSADYVTARPGATNGLNLILYVNQSDYLIANSPSAGFRFKWLEERSGEGSKSDRITGSWEFNPCPQLANLSLKFGAYASVLLHEPNERPLMKQWGFKVTPGYDTMIAITLSNLTMLPNPYGDCVSTIGYVYSDCMSTCESYYIMRVCGCREPEVKDPMRVCNPEEVDKCVTNASDAFVLNGEADNCECPRQCHQRAYQYTISQAEFSEYFADFITTYNFNNSFSIDFLRRNYVILEIFYSELTYEDIQTLASYDVLSLLCDIGGALGLILGSTVLTLFEILDFIFSLAGEEIMKRNRKK